MPCGAPWLSCAAYSLSATASLPTRCLRGHEALRASKNLLACDACQSSVDVELLLGKCDRTGLDFPQMRRMLEESVGAREQIPRILVVVEDRRHAGLFEPRNPGVRRREQGFAARN